MKGFSLIELMVAVAIVGVLVTIALPNYRAFQCRAGETEAKRGLKDLQALEEHYRAERDTYANVSARCATNASTTSSVTGTACISFAEKGRRPAFTFSATASAASAYTASAVGVTGTRSEGSIWQMDQNGRFTDVTGLCRTGR